MEGSWRQVELKNALAAIALWGGGFGLLRQSLVDPWPVPWFVWLIGCCGFLGAAIGMLFGRARAGLWCGVVGAGYLLLALSTASVALVVLTHR